MGSSGSFWETQLDWTKTRQGILAENVREISIKAIIKNPETCERLQTVFLARPAGYNLAYISEGKLNQKYKIGAKTLACAWSIEEQKKISPNERKTIHLLSGALLPIWKSFENCIRTG